MNQYPDFDQKLYDDLRRGKEYAFAAVFERYNRLLYTIAYRFLKSEEEAEDAIQYLFMKLWEQRTNFSFESGIRSLPVSYTHLQAHETRGNLVCRLLLEKKIPCPQRFMLTTTPI